MGRVKTLDVAPKLFCLVAVLGLMVAQVNLFSAPAYAQDSLDLQQVTDPSLTDFANPGNRSFIGVSDNNRYVAYKIMDGNFPPTIEYDIVKDNSSGSSQVANVLSNGQRISTNFTRLSSDGRFFFFANSDSLYERDLTNDTTIVLVGNVDFTSSSDANNVAWVSDDGSRMILNVCTRGDGDCNFLYVNISDASTMYAPPQATDSNGRNLLPNSSPLISEDEHYIIYTHALLGSPIGPGGIHSQTIIFDTQTQTSRVIYDSDDSHESGLQIGGGIGNVYAISNDGQYIFNLTLKTP